MRELCFWLLYTIAGIWAQSFIPGLDALAPAIVICLQAGRIASAFWLGFVWIFLQEGIGSLAFGSEGLLYAGLVALYALGRWLFESRNFLFMCLLGVGFSLLRAGVVIVVASLAGVEVIRDRLMAEALIQMPLFPVYWLVGSKLYDKYVMHHVRAIRV